MSDFIIVGCGAGKTILFSGSQDLRRVQLIHDAIDAKISSTANCLDDRPQDLVHIADLTRPLNGFLRIAGPKSFDHALQNLFPVSPDRIIYVAAEPLPTLAQYFVIDLRSD